MKKEIHPQYYPEAKIICACGNVITVGSTVKEMKVEVCSTCHPLYTGKKKLLDATGRVERFKKIAEKAAGHGADEQGRGKDAAGTAGAKTEAGGQDFHEDQPEHQKPAELTMEGHVHGIVAHPVNIGNRQAHDPD